MFSTRRRSLIALSSFAAYRKPGRRDDNGDGGNANPGGGGGTGTGNGQGGNTGGSGQQGGQSGGQQQGGQGNGQSGTGEAQLVEQLPGWAQRVISDLRRENAAKRTGSAGGDGGQGQQNNGQQGGQNGAAQGQQTNDATKNDEAIQAAQATARDSVVQLAAYRAAGTHGADPDLLLDSRSFVEKLTGLDPTANDFSTKLNDAIKKAVEENPKLRQVQAAGRSGGEFTGGPGGAAKKDVGTGVDRLRDAYAANQQT